MNKNLIRDRASGLALTAWMREHGFSDSKLGRDIQRSTPAVATWRKGTRPMARERDWLAERLGWHWDTPPAEFVAQAEALAIKAPKVVKAAKVVEAPKLVEAPKNGHVISEAAITAGSIEGLLLARTVISESRLLDPSTALDRLVLSVCGDLIDAEVARRGKKNRVVQQVIEVRQMVLGHRNPSELLAFLREHSKYSAEVLDMALRSLPGAELPPAQAMAEA